MKYKISYTKEITYSSRKKLQPQAIQFPLNTPLAFKQIIMPNNGRKTTSDLKVLM